MAPDTPSLYVNDLQAANNKELLNAYVYDFLVKSSLPDTAQSFVQEAPVPRGPPNTKSVKHLQNKELPPLAISLDAPQGFLYEWWQIFWDVFNARTHRDGSENAQHYYQLQLLRQHKEHALHNSTFHAAHTQAQAQAQAQAQLQAHVLSSYGTAPQSMVGMPPQMQQQQQQMLLQQRYQQQMLLLQYQQQQQHRNNMQFAQNGNANGNASVPSSSKMLPPQIALGGQFAAPLPPQMSPPYTQQQEFQQYFQQHQSQLYAGQKSGANANMTVGGASQVPVNPSVARVQQAQAQMNQFRQQQFGGATGPSIGQTNFKTPALANGGPGSGASSKGSNTPNKKMKLNDSSQKGSPLNGQSPLSKGDHLSPMTNSKLNCTVGSVPSPLINQTTVVEERQSEEPASQSALQDYQKQLMLLESENKKLLNGSKKDILNPSTISSKKPTKRMPPPKKQRTSAAASPSKTVTATPLDTSVSTTTPASLSTGMATSRKKKEPASRRRTKKTPAASSEPPTPTTPLTPNPAGTTNLAMLKKEPAPLSTKLHDIEEIPTSSQENNSNTPANPSQLTPPNSENANTTATNNDLVLSDSMLDPGNTMNATTINDDVDFLTTDTFAADEEIIGGSQIMSGGGQDLYSDFQLGDFGGDRGGDGNFNLETFLNTDGDMTFDNYWRDGVEATD